MDMHHAHFLVIGGGISGLTFALKVAELGKVHLLLKDDVASCSTWLAQGGINAVLDPEDSFESHIQDTLDCGYGLCDEDVVRLVVENGPRAVKNLAEAGVDFTKSGDHLRLHREGGHTHHRVVHAQDATGAAIMKALWAKTQAHPNITIFENHMAIDLIVQHPPGTHTLNAHSQAIGAYVLATQTKRVSAFLAPVTYLATGGIGKVYPYTSNAHAATGDGIVMAYRAGIEVVNMEFIQFHPTLLFHPKKRSFLISEVVRGEGGILRDVNGRAFMADYHPQMKELAPRDVVARAIDAEIKKSGYDCVYLDVTHLGLDRIQQHFPNIYQTLFDLGIDITKESIPVVPGAHYCCGGLRVDRDGRTVLSGLFAGGECTFTGLHGANRLASNSLLEGAVYGAQTAVYLSSHPECYAEIPTPLVAEWIYHDYSDPDEEALVAPLWREVRQFMWNYVGIVRSDKRLSRALARVKYLRKEIERSYWNFRISRDLVELRNISVIAELIVKSAVARKESRGLHYNIDHPQPDEKQLKDTVIDPTRHGLFR
ncbi:MAG: L-aspartate oxidase [Acidobacteria bacterium]|nr:L-aspartate oxidase [Acidobacteriota bacterium]MCB9399670.1 L-aspartate oxidase [Acidobacteriota bacterium]